MNDTEQNKTLAEWLGWTELRVILGGLKGVPPADWKGDTDSAGQAWVPDFGRDLNAMHRVWLALKDYHRELYGSCIADVLGIEVIPWRNQDVSEVANATAAQRREALLRTLNLYKP